MATIQNGEQLFNEFFREVMMGGNVPARDFPVVEATAPAPTRWEVQWSPKYGAPYQMIYYAQTKEECDKWMSEFGMQFSEGAIQTVQK